MPEPLSFDEVARLFETLGVKSFGAALPEGRIHWTDASGAIVAHAACQAILNWAGANHSLMWAEAMPHFRDAGVPCLPALDEGETYRQDVDETEAQELASQAAQLTGAQFLYAAPTGGGGKLYLAIRGFVPGAPQPDPQDEARRVLAARTWAQARLRQLAALLGQGRVDELPGLLRSFSGEARQQAEYVVPGTDLAPRLAGLATQSVAWASRLPDDAVQVAYALDVAVNGFDRP